MEAPDKIYICDFGSELSQDWHTEHCYEKDIEYSRTDAFIEKACEWLQKHARKYFFNKAMFLGTDELVEDFKLSMEI